MAEAVINPKSDDSTQPVPTVGAGSKETEIRANVQVSEALPKIEQEMSGFVKDSQPAIPHVPEVGLTPSAEAAPAKTEPTGAVVLPMTEQEADEVLKKGASNIKWQEIKEGEYVEDSRPFLAVLVRKIIDRMRGFVRKPA